MQSIQESLASWATLLASLVGFVNLFPSKSWLTGIGTVGLGAAISAILYARRNRLILMSASIHVEGRSLDCLNLANLHRRVNQSLVIQDVQRTIEIDGEELMIRATYSGYCRTSKETSIQFSIDSDNNIPFDHLDCSAFDLLRDPGMQHKIRPILLGSDGLSKKLTVPFLEPLTADRPFSVLLLCRLPGCMKSGFEYYTSTLSFDQGTVPRFAVNLRFVGVRPDWVRVYESPIGGTATLVKDLPPVFEAPESTYYEDVALGIGARSSRIYAFRRTAIG